MNILVTGGAGFIGSHVVASLIENGHNPIIVDNYVNSNPLIHERLEQLAKRKIPFYSLDVKNTEELTKLLKEASCDAVIHLAAHKSVPESVRDPIKYYDNNLAGLLSVLTAMKDADVRDIIFSSSTTVYGDPDSLPLTEESPIKPATNPYGATKQFAEEIIKDSCAAYGLRSVLLRYFNPIGAHPSGLIGELPIGTPTFLMQYIMQTVAGVRDKLIIFGGDYNTSDGTPTRDFIHIADLANAHVKSLDFLANKQKENVSIFNIGLGKPTSVLEVVKLFEANTGVAVPYEIGSRREGDVESSYSSIEKAKKELDWEPTLSVEDAIIDTWKWQQTLDKAVY